MTRTVYSVEHDCALDVFGRMATLTDNSRFERRTQKCSNNVVFSYKNIIRFKIRLGDIYESRVWKYMGDFNDFTDQSKQPEQNTHQTKLKKRSVRYKVPTDVYQAFQTASRCV